MRRRLRHRSNIRLAISSGREMPIGLGFSFTRARSSASGNPLGKYPRLCAKWNKFLRCFRTLYFDRPPTLSAVVYAFISGPSTMQIGHLNFSPNFRSRPIISRTCAGPSRSASLAERMSPAGDFAQPGASDTIVRGLSFARVTAGP